MSLALTSSRTGPREVSSNRRKRSTSPFRRRPPLLTAAWHDFVLVRRHQGGTLQSWTTDIQAVSGMGLHSHSSLERGVRLLCLISACEQRCITMEVIAEVSRSSNHILFKIHNNKHKHRRADLQATSPPEPYKHPSVAKNGCTARWEMGHWETSIVFQ